MHLFIGDFSLDKASSLKKPHSLQGAKAKETEGSFLEMAEGSVQVDVEPQPP